MANLTFLGTGLIGAALAQAAAGRGDAVTAWNRTRAKADALAPHGVAIADTPDEALLGADRVHLAFPDDAIVDAVLDHLPLPALRRTVLVDHTTTSPVATRARAERLAAQGVRYLHAPVFMSPALCLRGKGSMLVSGPQDAYDAVAAGLAAMTGTVHYLGAAPHKAAALKLFGNATIITLFAGLADVFAMADGLGVTPDEALTVFDGFNPAAGIPFRGKAMARGDYAPSFELTMARKDVRLMLEAAGDRPLAVLPAIAARMDALLARGHGADDFSILAVDTVPKA